MFEGLIGSLIWALANILYVDLKRKGKPGFSRIILFWMGTPLTWLWFFLLSEGSAPALEEAPDDADEILAEIRRDKRLEPGDGAGLDQGLNPGSESGQGRLPSG